MGLFETQPLLLVPLIIVTVATYDITKFVVRRMLMSVLASRGR